MRKPSINIIAAHLAEVLLSHGFDVAAAICYRIDRRFGDAIGDCAWSKAHNMLAQRNQLPRLTRQH